MTIANIPAPMHKTHGGISYTIELRENDSNIYLDIDELGLHHHEVHTNCALNAWSDLEKEADHAAFTIIDLHNAAPKGLF